MVKRLLQVLASMIISQSLFAQNSFPYSVSLHPVTVPGMQGLHSYAFAQHQDKWLIVGGRKDGIHARQPFNAFPASQNNDSIYVVDIQLKRVWAASLNSLPTSLKEQLQSTNMNFYQDKDTLVVVGGYAFSSSVNNHITFPYLTTVGVAGLMNAVINAQPIQSFFKQLTHTNFAVTGGQLGKIGNTFYLVGGQRFDGRYNPFNNPTFTQAYTNQVRKFTLNNSGSQLSFANYEAITDPVHLHRRDYNLVPQVFPDGTHGYIISSGVFQENNDLPFLYPVEIKATGHTPITSFNQYLSNYHSAKLALYDSAKNEMHALFFGGISQYYYHDGTLIQDNQVPFVKTISRLTRLANGQFQEFALPVQMPGLEGAGAEFIINRHLPHYDSEIIQLHKITGEGFVAGYIFGGIKSPVLNAFETNQSSVTTAGSNIYQVVLTRNTTTSTTPINGSNPYRFEIFPNPAHGQVQVRYHLAKPVSIDYYITNASGQLLQKGILKNTRQGNNTDTILLPPESTGALLINMVFDGKYFAGKTIIHQ